MTIKIWQVDAFTDEPFRGNPAAVCLLDTAIDEDHMQAIALEMNLSETAFVVPRGDGFQLRWFTPACEVRLCGHATLASAHVLWTEGVVDPSEKIAFHTLHSGTLTARRDGDRIELDFPASPPEEIEPPNGLAEALGLEPVLVARAARDVLVLAKDEAVVRGLEPDFSKLGMVEARGVIVTAPAAEFDFVSRFFGPAVGIDEDPVTGSAHCSLAPFWGERLGRAEMIGFQASPRGGVVHVTLNGDRVLLAGSAVTTLRGELMV
ncbi:MAG: PhzF family phenazine biosynthesis protein [Thermoanaerobaculales bacterium]|nr:PhzF family phenazine biosynthesis protein [Thermoanaerobaculales bacterium]